MEQKFSFQPTGSRVTDVDAHSSNLRKKTKRKPRHVQLVESFGQLFAWNPVVLAISRLSDKIPRVCNKISVVPRTTPYSEAMEDKTAGIETHVVEWPPLRAS